MSIRFSNVSVRYDGAGSDTLRGVDLDIPAGEFALVVGPTGAGKSTLLGLVNGHVPHFTGGTVRGAVTVAGRDVRLERPRDLADVVGVVAQDPRRGFVTDRVDDELAYTMESLALPLPVMRRRVEDTLDLLGLVELRDRPLATLSGGQQQRVAIGAALTAHPQVLVLDEPTSALDPAAAEEVLAALHRLVHDLGVTVLLAEHRLERVIGDVDSVVLVGADGSVRHGDPAAMMAIAPVAPPVVELGRYAGWAPLPLTVRDARRRAGALRDSLPRHAPAAPARVSTAPLLQADELAGGHDGRTTVVGPLTLTAAAGELIAVMGRNGAGKSTLLWTLAGALAPVRGEVRIDGRVPRSLAPAQRRTLVTLVPQQPADLLYHRSVADELAQADRDAGIGTGDTAALLDQLAPGIDPQLHPRDLSEGQRLALVLAIQLAARPAVLLLDEPTRGLDYPGKERLTALLRDRAARGTLVVLASHDVEFVAGCCERAVILADGRVIADGPAAEVLTASPTYAPQIAKILAPAPLLTIGQLRTELEPAP
jgi:energy-coupling factor transport system ATP-binding protein